jgi:flavin reductase (DIM6/NTAB) family NADH-FMN oxidoreductase RutF
VTGAPLLPDTVASFDCRLEAEHDAGDHVIFVGRIEHVVTRDLEPLVYLSGRYGSLAPLDG